MGDIWLGSLAGGLGCKTALFFTTAVTKVRRAVMISGLWETEAVAVATQAENSLRDRSCPLLSDL